MTAASVLLDLHALGVRLEAWGDRLHVDAPAGTLTPKFRETLAREKPALLEALRDPRRAAYRTWEGVMEEVAAAWEAHAKEARAASKERAWIDDVRIMGCLREAILATTDAQTLWEALDAVEAWRGAWLGLLGVQVEPPRSLGAHAPGPRAPRPVPAPPCRLSRLWSPPPTLARASCSRRPRRRPTRPRGSTGAA